MGVAEFFTTLYGEEAPGYLVLWTLEGKKSAWYPYADIEKAVKLAGDASQKSNVYFGVSLQDKEGALELASIRNNRVTKPSETRGYAETAVAIPGVWVDIDIAGTNHKQADLPKDLTEAQELVKAFPLQPTLLVHTGGGLHAYWLFKEPWVFESSEERDAAQELVASFQATLRAEAKKRSWVLDSTFDLARVLRIPGTFNRKSNPPKAVTILEHNVDSRYNPDDIEQYCIEQTAEEKRGPKVDVGAIFAGIPEGGRDNELFKYACRLRAQGRAKDEALVLVLAAAAKCQPPFAEEEARAKVDSAWKYQEGTPESRDVKEQVDLVAMADLPNNPEQVFEPEVIGALAVMRDKEPAQYAKLKARLKGRVNLNDLERLVKLEQRKGLHLVTEDEPAPLIETVLPDLPVKGLIMPHSWHVSIDGIRREDENRGLINACGSPVVITKRLQEIDSEQERVEISFYRDRKWQRITTDKPTLFSNTAIIQLSSRKLPVSSANAKDLVQYLTDFERVNKYTLPITSSVRHMGWAGGKNFLPGLEGEVVLDLDEGLNMVASKYREQGELVEWIEMILPIYKHTLPRIYMAASFAGPLLMLINSRVFAIHLWGPSRGGKTATMKAALSVWGEAEGIMTSFNSTKVGLERLANLYSDLPLGIDERQMVGDNQAYLEGLIYMLSAGKGKTRGNRGGGIQQHTSWRSIILTTGEFPISTDSSAAGVRSRVLEFYGLPLEGQEEYASSLHQRTDESYGTAGPAFVRRLSEELKNNQDMVRDDHKEVFAYLKEKAGEKIMSHLSYLATLTVADYYSAMFIFGKEPREAFDSAIEFAEQILIELETASDSEDARRAYDYLMAWYDMNGLHFTSNPPNGKSYGTTELDYLMINPLVFETAMKEGGFSGNRVLRDWAKRGIIRTESRIGEGKVRFKIRRRLGGGEQKYFIAVKLDWEEIER